MNLFAKAVADVLEVDEIGLDDDFRQVDGWCSLKAFGILVAMENDWHAPVGVDAFAAMRTVRDLYREAFLAFAADLLGTPRSSLSGDTRYGSIPQWDSVAHLRLVMEAEARFGVRYPLERIPEMRSLDDFLV